MHQKLSLLFFKTRAVIVSFLSNVQDKVMHKLQDTVEFNGARMHALITAGSEHKN